MMLRRASSLAAHVSIFVLVVIAVFGNVARLKLKLVAPVGQKVAERGLPYMVQLESFSVDYYEDSLQGRPDPKQFSSRLILTAADGTRHVLDLSVNHPATLGPWRFYQSGYDSDAVVAEKESSYSVIEAVRDPMWPVARIALWLMMLSAVLLIVDSVPDGKAGKWLWLVIGTLFVLFIWWVFAKLGMGSRNLRPVLRSPWFIPHIVAYMFAYACLSASTVYASVLWVRNASHPAQMPQTRALNRLVRFGWSFLTLGMMMGALWAKEAWGDYWTWDPKETWALITWCAYLTYMHLTSRIKDRIVAYALLIVAFLLLQMCWYGVNYLPSAASSMHVY